MDEKRLDKIRKNLKLGKRLIAAARARVWAAKMRGDDQSVGIDFVVRLVSDIEYLLGVIREMEQSAGWQLQKQIDERGREAFDWFSKMIAGPIENVSFCGRFEKNEEMFDVGVDDELCSVVITLSREDYQRMGEGLAGDGVSFKCEKGGD